MAFWQENATRCCIYEIDEYFANPYMHEKHETLKNSP